MTRKERELTKEVERWHRSADEWYHQNETLKRQLKDYQESHAKQNGHIYNLTEILLRITKR